jgi:hypothetical protein
MKRRMKILVHVTPHAADWHRAFTLEGAARSLSARKRLAIAAYLGVGIAGGLALFAMQSALYAYVLLGCEAAVIGWAVWPRAASPFTFAVALRFLATRRWLFAACLVAPIAIGIAGIGLVFAAKDDGGPGTGIAACFALIAAGLVAMAVHRARRAVAVSDAILARPISWACAQQRNAIHFLLVRFGDGTRLGCELPRAVVAGVLLDLERQSPRTMLGYDRAQYGMYVAAKSLDINAAR